MTQSKKLISINRLRRTAEQLLKSVELAESAHQVADTNDNDLWNADEVANLKDWTAEVVAIRNKIASLANDLQQRLSEQKSC